MTTMSRIITTLIAVVALATTVVACDDDDTNPVAGEPQPDLVDTAIASGSFETLVTALQAAELVETLRGPGPFTVFAPTDAAFEALPEGTLEDLLRPENRDQLTAILTYHVVPGRLLAEDVLASTSLPTVQGQSLTVGAEGGDPRVDSSSIVQTDIEASNGVIHVIDSVLIPE